MNHLKQSFERHDKQIRLVEKNNDKKRQGRQDKKTTRQDNHKKRQTQASQGKTTKGQDKQDNHKTRQDNHKTRLAHSQPLPSLIVVNETSLECREYCLSQRLPVTFVPPQTHRSNPAERAVRTG
jgi:hypothetical protein